MKEIKKKKSIAVIAAAVARAATRRGEERRQRSVFIQAEKERDDYGQTATAQNVGTERAVLRTEHEQSDENPKGNVTLIATSHNKPPVFCRRGYVLPPSGGKTYGDVFSIT